jgi:hypothetical protein
MPVRFHAMILMSEALEVTEVRRRGPRDPGGNRENRKNGGPEEKRTRELFIEIVLLCPLFLRTSVEKRSLLPP